MISQIEIKYYINENLAEEEYKLDYGSGSGECSGDGSGVGSGSGSGECSGDGSGVGSGSGHVLGFGGI